MWIVSAWRKDTKEVVRFSVGSRTNKTLRRVTDTLGLANTLKIYTDKLKQYSTLIDQKVHNTKTHGTNHVERMHLNLRTHLKRLNRRTICFSKSMSLLIAILKIYFWG
ncbi:MAG: IS1 family transposase [Bacteroidales bacterium]|nr:IS1 family transposase [Bacteroidales bacterium]MCF8457330.1 IS1 family transposase [Bacteroidales bacterium]